MMTVGRFEVVMVYVVETGTHRSSAVPEALGAAGFGLQLWTEQNSFWMT